MNQYVRKWLNIPAGEVAVEASELWEVRWTSRSGAYSHEVKPEVEVFPFRKDAEDFADAIGNAFKLLKYTGLITTVTLTKRN